ncbi:hypothetical protein [Yoonia sp.]|uniref:hypothetical protein n=1 Tax=Yoonia sp. TaxID=2212373 RepID=UPI0025F7C15B|nr:hypothetical protein [Yoonia sp.]
MANFLMGDAPVTVSAVGTSIVDAVNGDTALPVTLIEGVNALDMAQAATLSTHNNKTVALAGVLT